MIARFLGVDHRHAFFKVRSNTVVVVDTHSLETELKDFSAVQADHMLLPASKTDRVDTWRELALAAVVTRQPREVTVTASGLETRAFTVPKLVADSARKALKNVGDLTPVSHKVATVLAGGAQVKLGDVAFISRYFNNNIPTSPYWAAWGGDAGKKWSMSTVERFKETLTAAGDPEVNLIAFYEGEENQRRFWAQKADSDSEHVVALFRRGPADTWVAWSNGDWADIDLAPTEDQLVELDDDTAVYVAGSLYDAPDTPVSLRDLDPEVWDMTEDAKSGIDWGAVDRVMTPEALRAAGEQYTPEERSKNVQSQPRDANGKFAKVGATGLMKSGQRAKIVTVNPLDQSLIVRDDAGNTYAIAARDFAIDDGAEQPAAPAAPVDPNAPAPPQLDLDEILGQPRASVNTPKAMLPRLLQPMGPAQLKEVLSDYQAFIHRERQSRAKDFHGGTGWKDKGTNPVRAAGDVEELTLALEEKPTPESSDVPPIYMALVDREDPRAVTDLVALIPASATSDEVGTFKRIGGEWVEDAAVLQDLRSPTPPPVVKLDAALYQDVLTQVDNSNEATDEVPAAPADEIEAAYGYRPDYVLAWDENGELVQITADGGLDQNRGNAEKLRRYWLYGEGAAKIRWNTPGDWTRCVRQLSKHLGPRAKGYCALRHHEATGMWTGDKEHLGRENSLNESWVGDPLGEERYAFDPNGIPFSSRDDIRDRDSVLTASADEARRLSVMQRVYGMTDAISPVPQSAEDIDEGRLGRAFKIPLVIPEGLESGDGRSFTRGSLSMRSFPLPLMWQVKTGDGHDGSFLVGRVDRVERTEDGLGNAYGYFDTGPYGQEAQRLVENKMLRWVSADLDKFEADEEELAEDGSDEIKTRKLKVTKGRLMGITLVAKPAFQECTIELVPLQEAVAVPDGVYEGEAPELIEPEPELEESSVTASASIASHIPVEPPKLWFDRPVLNGPTPLSVTDEGQVFGHIATWDQGHIGRPDVASAPRNRSGYSYFHTGVLRTADGDDVTVGQLTLAGGHAGAYDDALSAIKHYDDTGSAIADVHIGEDSYGIWAAGALRPGTTPEQVRALRASAPSGDWRPINGRLELVAVCQVNVPGFPVPRACVASGSIQSLVAAGTADLVRLRAGQSSPATLSQRLERLERYEQERLETVLAAAQARVFKVLDVDGYLSEFKDFPPEKRKQLAKDKLALKDGSFPIENGADLRRAIRAYGRAEESKRGSVRRHIVRRARALGKLDMVPKDWSEASVDDLTLSGEDARERVITAALESKVDTIKRRLKSDQ